MAQTEHWPRHHAVEASAFAISSSTCMNTSGAGLGAAEALRQKHPVKPVLDQGGNHRCGEPAGAFDLVGLPRDQRRKRLGPLDQSETGKLVHAFPWPVRGFLVGEAAMVVHLGARIKVGEGAEAPSFRGARSANPESRDSGYGPEPVIGRRKSADPLGPSRNDGA